MVEEVRVARRGGLALWRQIAQALEAEIRQGQYQPGSQLPTEAQLAARFQVNRHTLRRAIAALAEAGLLRVEQGRGTFVQEETLDYLVDRRTRFSENVQRLGRRPGGQVLRAETLPASPQVAAGLGMPRGAPVILLELLHLVDGRPVAVTSHYFPKARFPTLIEAYRETGSLARAMKAHGVLDHFRRSTRVTAKLPSIEDARQLHMPRTQPVMVHEDVNVDETGRIVEYAVSRCAAQRMQLVFEP
ncbi:MAG: phosphonate metabolism transcriptional regulator PhnF [Alphaproteobacteria bacterium]|nr:phosphonate metabolism transcriptional regulator PhnF [Alphaproteobacteria bacterium]